MRAEGGNVLNSLSQRRQTHDGLSETEVQVQPHAPAAQVLLGLVGGGDDLHIAAPEAVAADGEVRPLLQHPQELALQMHGKLGYRVTDSSINTSPNAQP